MSVTANHYLDARLQKGLNWRILWACDQTYKNFQIAFSSTAQKVEAIAKERIAQQTVPPALSLASRVKHLIAGLFLAIPLVSAIAVLVLRHFGNVSKPLSTQVLTPAPLANEQCLPHTPLCPESNVSEPLPAQILTPAAPLAEDECLPHTLLCPERFDLMAKIIYAELRKKGVSSSWGEEIYAAHIKAWNDFHEPQNTIEKQPQKTKICREDFVRAFDQILDDIGRDGFDRRLDGIPVGSEDGIVLNGAHRLAACYIHEKPVKYFKSPPPKEPWNWDYEYWIHDRHLDRKYTDAMALKYCEVKQNLSALALFPKRGNPALDAQVNQLIREYGGKIAYAKEVQFNQEGAKQFVLACYLSDPNHSWVGTSENDYEGAANHAKGKFPNGSALPMKVLLLESHLPLEKLVELKAKIRALYGVDKASAHLTDTYEQALELAQTVLNENTIHFFNHRKNGAMPKFELFLDRFKQEIKEKGLDPNDLCINGGAVLAAYGLRDCNDLDFLYYGAKPPVLGKSLECHNEELGKHGLSPDEIIYNPQNHFWYRGLKFSSLDALKKLKEVRNEPKDQKDIALISSI